MKTTLIKDGEGRSYLKTESETCYYAGTDNKLIEVLENLQDYRETRIRVFLGDTKTGKVWNEEHDVTGYIGRSTGSIKIPLLVYNKRSYSGGALLTHCILKVIETKTKKVLYQHPKFQQPVITLKSELEKINIYINGELFGIERDYKKALKVKSFMSGQSF